MCEELTNRQKELRIEIKKWLLGKDADLMDIIRELNCYNGSFNDYEKFNAFGDLNFIKREELKREIENNIEEVINELLENFIYVYIHSDLEELCEAYIDEENKNSCK